MLMCARWILGLAIFLTIIFGCRRPPQSTAKQPAARQEACNAADTSAICAQVQKCFQSHVSSVVCRELEEDAIQVSRTPTQPDDNGAAEALKY